MVPEFTVKRLITLSSKDGITLAFTGLSVVATVAYYVINQEYKNTSPIGFLIILFLMGTALTMLTLPATRKIRFFDSDNVGTLLFYSVASAITYLWYVPLYSPFIIPSASVMFLALYYRGIVAYFVTIGSLTALVALYTLKNGLPHLPHAYLFPVLTVVFGAAYGGAISRAGALNSQVRQEMNRVTRHVAEDREQLVSLINSMREAVLAIDPNGNVLFFNPSALALLNVHTITVGGKLSDLISFYDKPKHVFNLLELIKKQRGYVLTRALHFIANDTAKIDLSIDVAPIHAAAGSNSEQGYIMLLRDITKEKTLDDQRNEFISVTSHELRTPLAIAEASVSLVMSPATIEKLDESSRKRLKQAHENIIFLADLVNVLTTLEMAERQSLSIDVDEVNAGTILQELVTDYQEEATKKGLQIKAEIDDGLPIMKTSPVFLREILQNLVTNSLKYTDSGSITLAVKKDENNMIFSVQDTGIGISSSDKPRVFDKYYRSEDFRTQENHGTGLGLYMVNRLTGYLHGKVWFKSELGKGSTFYVQLPVVFVMPVVQPRAVTPIAPVAQAV